MSSRCQRRFINPSVITSGPDHVLWFTETDVENQAIGRIDTSGAIPQYSRGIREGVGLTSITEGPAAGGTASLYFTESLAGKIGSITTQGVVTKYPITVAGSSPQGITLGPDNNLWLTDDVASANDNPDMPEILTICPTGTLIHDYVLPVQ